MVSKDARLELRLDPAVKARLEQAAAMTRQSTSSFVAEASIAAADKVLGAADVTFMPAEQFDELMAALDVPDDAPELARLAARPSRVVRR
jgi:uncharacterized protein (DUF1778 family)